MRRRTLRGFRKASCDRPLPLQPLPAAIREAFSTVIFVHSEAIRITGGTAVFDDIGASGLRVLRRYCPRCGSPLTTESDATPGIFFVKAGSIDANEWFHPDMEMFVTRRRPWIIPVAGAAQFDGNPTF